MMSNFPMVKIGELAAPQVGTFKIGPFGSLLKKDELVNSGIPVAGIENVLPNKFSLKYRKYITDKKYFQLEQYTILPNDVLVTTMGTIGRAAVVPGDIGTAIMDSHLFRMRVDTSKVLPSYLSYALNGYDDLKKELVQNARGAIMQGLNTKILKGCSIPLPSIPEQERIIHLLDEAESLRATRDRADERMEQFIPALFQKMFGNPVNNPMNWFIAPFSEVSKNQDGRRIPVKSSDRDGKQGIYPYYGASGIIDYVDEYIFDERALLIGEDGANLLARSTPIAFIAEGKYWVNNHAHVITENGKADLDYLCYALNLRDITEFVTGSAQPKLNQANLNRIPIALPPLALQREFAARVEEARGVQSAQGKSAGKVEALYQSMLSRAFEGEL
jgi:type I restriction enzyme S subunit